MFREQLMKALDSAVKHYNGGLGDNDSVIKAAADSQFNPDQTQRLLETYNTAKSIYFFKVANDRRDSFPLADPGVVMPALFSGEARAKAKAATTLPDQDFYSTREFQHDGKWSFDQHGARQTAGEPMQKAAEARSQLSLDALYRSLRKQAAISRQVAERCRATAGNCTTLHNRNLNKLAEFVRQDYHETDRLAQVEHYAWALHGRDLAEPVIKDLLTCLPSFYATKRASDRLAPVPSDFENRHCNEAELLKEAFKARFAAGQQEALAVTFDKEAGDMISEWEKIAGLAPPDPGGGMASFFEQALRDQLSKKAANPVYSSRNPALNQMAFLPGTAGQQQSQQSQQPKTPKQPKIEVQVKDKGDGGGGKKDKGTSESLFGKALTGGTAAIGGGLAEAFKAPAQKALTGLMSGDSANDERKLTGTLRNMQRKLILEDLIVNDPVLSGEDPQAVVTAYHTLINLAPDVSLNKEIARSVVRASVNAVAMSPFDAKAIAELEGEMRKNLGYTLPKAEGARA